MSTAESAFYVTGGTLRPDAPSYVERRADRDLLDGLLQGEFCYVLTSRQMGKSSLMVRTTKRLRDKGIHVAILDLTAIGQNLTPTQWYDGLISKLGQQLDLEDELFEFWQANDQWGPLQRWMTALEKVVLPNLESNGEANSDPPPSAAPKSKSESDLARSRLVIFIDEIDMVRSLPFPTDELFAAIRECYNRRPHDPEFQRVTFCLLGVATPSELIRDTRVTPFNIGLRIELTDFDEGPASSLARGFYVEPKAAGILLKRIFHWTNGHPYLTQRLCRAVAEANQIARKPATLQHLESAVAKALNEPKQPASNSAAPIQSPESVDQLCEELFLVPRARETDDNLLFVRERLLRTGDDLGGVLHLYHHVRTGKRIRDDESNPLIHHLRLAGITRVEKGFVQIRNKIYHHVFDHGWVQANLPASNKGEAKVEDFQRRHHVGLMTLLCAEVADAAKLREGTVTAASEALLLRHHAMFREMLGQFRGAEEIELSGDSFLVAFQKPSDAVRFALLFLENLRVLAHESSQAIADRIGIHTGEVTADEREGSAQSRELYRWQIAICSRVAALAERNRILLTRSAFDHARQALKRQDFDGAKTMSWANHGSYVLKDIEEPVEICEIAEVNPSALKPPRDSENARRHSSPGQELVLGWRPASGQCVPNTRWVLQNKIGQGAFGELWLGHDERLKHKRRAFKFCFREDRARSLKREATLFKLLREKVGEHPNIVGIHEVYFERPPYYLGMDYVEGKDLCAWWDLMGGTRNVPLAARLEIVAQVADALNAAHAAGVVHRDVKPSNILIESKSAEPQDVRVRLTDFGIGQIVSDEVVKSLTMLGMAQPTMLPGAGAQIGTYIYMAPELLAGKPASPQSDIYSLGVVLYQLVLGDLSRPVTMDWVLDDAQLREHLMRCFAGDPSERFATAGHLAHKLRAHSQRLQEKQRGTQVKKQTTMTVQERTAFRRALIRNIGFALFWIGIAVAIVLITWHFF